MISKKKKKSVLKYEEQNENCKAGAYSIQRQMASKGKEKQRQTCSALQRFTSGPCLFRCPVPRRPTPTWTATCSTSLSYHRRPRHPHALLEHLSTWWWVGWAGSWFRLRGGMLMGCHGMPGSEHRPWHQQSPVNTFFFSLTWKRNVKFPEWKEV